MTTTQAKILHIVPQKESGSDADLKIDDLDNNNNNNNNNNNATGGSKSETQSINSPSRHRKIMEGLSDEEILKMELKITNFIVDRPVGCLCGCGFIFILLTFIGFGIIGFSLSDGELKARDDVRTERHESLERVIDYIDAQPTGTGVSLDAPRQSIRSAYMSSFSVIYEGADVLSLEAMRFMREIEDHILQDKQFPDFCKVSWFPMNSACPGTDCPWYMPNWDVTGKYPMPDGSKLVCSAPLTSISWVAWNMRLATPSLVNGTVVYDECDVVGNFELCVQTAMLSFIRDLRSTTRVSLENIETLASTTGIEPTPVELTAFLRACNRLRRTSYYPWLNMFFGKSFADPSLPDSDPLKWTAKHSRGSITFGGPPERVQMSTMTLPCQAYLTKQDCENEKGCLWNNFSGMFLNHTGCAYDQFMDVPKDTTPGSSADQIKDLANWIKDFTTYYDNLNGPVEALYFADGIMFEMLMAIMMRDALLAVVSFMFVYLYLQIHTGSFFLATLGMIQVIMPFPMGYFVYRVLFQVKAFYGLSGLTLYIVLAIGADDIFVFMDNWVQANVKPRADNCTYLKGRMAHAWKIAGTAMGITSMTTMAAFIATMTSPLLEIGLFGLFAAILVFFDYLLVMTFFACAVVIYHRNYENTLGCCCCGNQMMGKWCNCCTCYTHLSDNSNLDFMEAKLLEARTFETLEEARAGLGQNLDQSQESPRKVASPDSPLIMGDLDDTELVVRKRACVILILLALALYLFGYIAMQKDHESKSPRFPMWLALMIGGLLFFCASMNVIKAYQSRRVELGFKKNAESEIVQHTAAFLSGTMPSKNMKLLRFAPCCVMIAVWIFMVVSASKLTPTTKNEQWLPDWHPIQRFMTSLSSDFPSNDQDSVPLVRVSVGLNPWDTIDRSGTDRYDPDDLGEPNIWSEPGWQDTLTSEAFQLFAIELCDQTYNRSKQPGAFIQRHLLGIQEQNCIMKGFRDWLGEHNETFPVPQGTYLSRLWDFVVYSNKHESFVPHLVYNDKILFKFGDGTDRPPTGISVMFFTFNTSLQVWGNPHDAIKDWHDDWDSWIGDVNSGDLPWVQAIYPNTFPLKDKIIHSADVWVWMHTQLMLVRGAISGTLMSLSLATAVVFGATLNILMALIVLLELLGVVGYVLGMVELLGWELGMIESVAITILVGLSVDYVVHFAVHYNHVSVETGDTDSSFVTERQKRVYEVVSDMGPTVLGGAATSIGAALILLCTWVQFFYKFGVFFLLTVAFSYLWAMFFFLPVLSLVGPENEFLSVRPYLAKLLPKIFATRAELAKMKVAPAPDSEE